MNIYDEQQQIIQQQNNTTLRLTLLICAEISILYRNLPFSLMNVDPPQTSSYTEQHIST